MPAGTALDFESFPIVIAPAHAPIDRNSVLSSKLELGALIHSLGAKTSADASHSAHKFSRDPPGECVAAWETNSVRAPLTGRG